MTANQERARFSAKKAVAIGGFIGGIILIAWLSVQLTQFVPNAFSSLASLAESVREYQPANEEGDAPQTLTVTSDETLVPVDQPVTVSWSKANLPGNYTFTYSCVDGVSITVLNDSELRAIDCDQTYDLGSRNTLTISLDSVKERYADIAYTIGYYRPTDDTPRATGNASLTVVNSSLTTRDDTVVVDTDESTPSLEETVPETSSTPSEPTSPTPPSTPEPTPVYSYRFPESDAAGYTDLGINYIDAGSLGVNERFAAGDLEAGERGAIQFAVQNHGTKTSDEWTFTVELPNGTTYESDRQAALLPNERALLTVGFLVPNDRSSHLFTGEVIVDNDRTDLNDRFVVREVIRD